MSSKLCKIEKVESRDFYKEIYKHASSFKNMWIVKPIYIFILVISSGIMVVTSSILISFSILSVLSKSYELLENIEHFILIIVICVLIYTLFYVRRIICKKHGRPKKYLKYLYDIKKLRLLNSDDINVLILDIEFLIGKEKLYTRKLFKTFKNLTLAVYLPIVLFSVQAMEDSIINSLVVIVAYIIIAFFMFFYKSDTFEVLEYFYVGNYYMYFKVKQELEYMKTIKNN